MTISKRIVLHFPKRLVDRPIVSRLVKDYNLDFNILKASVTQQEEGLMIIELSGATEDYDRGIQYLQDTGVRIQSLGHDIIRNEERCTNCGVCVAVCPAGAFELESVTRNVTFLNEKCIACELCLKACPPRAMELHL
ncbi:MAG: NIL domain-containing protein [Chloroflexota bacterium]